LPDQPELGGQHTNETYYKVERSRDGGSFTLVANLGANTTSYANTGLSAGVRYYYRVGTSDGTNVSYSAVVSTTTLAPPPAPTNLAATPVSSTRIDLSWSDNAGYEQGFRVERSSDGVSFTQIASTGANVTSYSNTLLTASTMYYYRVRAYDGINNSGYSNTASVTTPDTTALRAP
jgi:phosphodiesterase/alkaline phosphatase D-like protein